MNRSVRDISVLLIILSFLSNQKFSKASDTIDTTRSIRYNNSLVSSGGRFELGFFRPGNSNYWYVGIWFKHIPNKTVVWVANRQVPLKNRTSGLVKVVEPGTLVVLNETNGVIWSSNTSRAAKNPVLQLLDSGNLVLREANDDPPENYLWQSFDHPTDTLLPGMRLGMNSIPGGENYLSCWKSSDDPAPGDFTLFLDPTGYPQAITKKNGVEKYRLGPWNGMVFSGTPEVKKDPSFTFGVYRNKDGGFYYREDAIDRTAISRYTLNSEGVGQRWLWVDRTQDWVLYMNNPIDNCDDYKSCGAYGICTVGNFPVCGCLDKFEPKDPAAWGEADWSNGCVRRTPLACTSGDGFLKYSGIKFPDARNTWNNESMTLEECKVECLKNCSCMAYSNLNIDSGGSGCLLWMGDLADVRVLSVPGLELYIRMASSELGSNGKTKEIVSLTIVGTVLLGLSVLLYIWKRKRNITKGKKIVNHTANEDLELPLFDLSTISKATNNFSFQNKLGEGGYGPVYKGTLQDGQDIAVKRLSETSKQGLDEFKNEVIFIAKLQHRNLVKLLGCCIQGEEKMLIYDYMPNRSLDMFLFDHKNRRLLDWSKRFHIANGIARGLMYLHQDSWLRIIHRDLKASNILLDSEMNAKISDFGIARTCRENETENKTSRVVGTYGYMSPEYAVCGRFSVKLDVFSFGVIVLEIVSGKRNSSYSEGDRHLNLLGHAWLLYKEGRSIELADSSLSELENAEVVRLIHVGLLCVQQNPDDRPTMTTVVSMLTNDSELPQANQPGFFTETDSFSISSPKPRASINELTITMQGGR